MRRVVTLLLLSACGASTPTVDPVQRFAHACDFEVHSLFDGVPPLLNGFDIEPEGVVTIRRESDLRCAVFVCDDASCRPLPLPVELNVPHSYPPCGGWGPCSTLLRPEH